jgi:hypothetical protein
VLLKKYAGREGEGEFRPMTLTEAKCLSYGQHIWCLSNSGDARRVKINGAPKTWKRSPQRLEVPVKYGMYEYARFDENDIERGRLLVEVSQNKVEEESESSKHCDAGYMNDMRFGAGDDPDY